MVIKSIDICLGCINIYKNFNIKEKEVANFSFNGDTHDTDDFDDMALEEVYENIRMIFPDLPADPYDLIIIVNGEENDYSSAIDYTITEGDVIEFKQDPGL